MTQAADIIQALLARTPGGLLERHTHMPYGWGMWLRTLRQRLGPVASGASADEIVAVLAQRPPSAPAPPEPVVSFPHTFVMLLLRPGGEAPRPDERGAHWAGVLSSLLIHLLFALLLLWFALVQLHVPMPTEGESSRVRLEFIGQGTPEAPGEGAPAQSASTSTVAMASANASAARPVAVATPAMAARVQAEVPAIPERDIPEPATPQQILQVTNTPEPTIEFVLPPPVPRDTAMHPRPLAQAEPRVQVRDIPVVEAPVVAPAIPVPVAAPDLQREAPQVRQREIPAPLPQVAMPQTEQRALPAPSISTVAPVVRQRDIPGPATRSSDAASTVAPATATAVPSIPAVVPTPQGGTRPAGTGAGPAATPQSGSWVTPSRADDWGDSSRQVAGQPADKPGQGPGLFNSDGSLRIPASGKGSGDAPRGAPGGDNDAWTRERLEQAGTWLKRPPYDYTPTSFDKYWTPNESLLAEWVRKGIQEMSIPIPGTSKKLSCVVSILQLGGGCGISDPNLNDQPAIARPPPDIPFKPELQEDNGSIRPPAKD